MRKQQTQNTIKYVCTNCGAKEEIPVDVIGYFDEINCTCIFVFKSLPNA
ncbi:hypothetical protein Bccel_1371 [Pseudobacteroides cellulosolvens ATCC 35603 = DSM 2933]|uniref:Uncharacterized protein n=1 Tax=Pseudobacteroides cellulosolvens ATCC 35603 = DSM 2933 TaxID=398512 RepID=A0A0L6JK07_9FIRM|nr:hypothetical protein Bccel_1371 [Pseudobacteroides cellulosolvens ATCC 35603 = DSM 2933]